MPAPTMDDNTKDLFWQMLREIEEHCDPKKDILNKLLVEAAYKHWNKCHPNNHCPPEPRWNRK